MGIKFAIVFFVGLIFYAKTVAVHWRESNHQTVAHYFQMKYGRNFSILSGIILFVAMSGFSATYVKSLALIFMPIVNINFETLIISITLLILICTLRGGLQAIIKTDVFIFIAFFAIIPLVIYFAYTSTDIPKNYITLSEGLLLLNPRYVISLLILTMFSYILAPWYSQKIVSAKNSHVPKKSVYTSAVIIYLLYASSMLLCYKLRIIGVQIDDMDSALPRALQHMLPVGILGIVYGILFGIGATTLTGVWNAMVSILTLLFHKNASASHAILLTMICSLISVLLGIYCIDSLLQKMILANIPVISVSFALLGGLYWSRTTTSGAVISVIVGCLGASSCYLYYGEIGMYTWYWAMYIIPLIFIFGIFGSLAYPSQTALGLKTNSNI